MNRYFTDCRTIPELKKAYRAAVKQNHPDKGGDTATMQRINAEYEARTAQLTRGPKAARTTQPPKPPKQPKTTKTEKPGPTAEDWAQEAREVHEYEVKINAQYEAYNKRLRRDKAKAAEAMAADPELAELVNMTGQEICYESKLIHWSAISEKWYYEARSYVNRMRATVNAKELHIRWETYPPQ